MTAAAMRRLRMAAVLAGVLLVPATAGAQAPGTPLLLTPPVQPEAAPAPKAESAPPTIAVDTLEAPRPDALGLVDTRGGGFPDAMWQGGQAEAAKVLLATLPRRYAGPAARGLALRFLLSAAPPPGGNDGVGGAHLLARLQALAGLAAWDDVLALIDLVPAEARAPALQRLRIDGLLVQGKTEAACGETQQALAETPEARWQKVQVLCQFAAGQVSAAGLGLDVLREQGVEDRPFFWAADAMQGKTAPPPQEMTVRGAPLDPLVAAMLRRAGRPLPTEIVDTGDPTALRIGAQLAAAADKLAANDPSLDLRLTTVERAVAAGVADVAVLAALYGKVGGADPQGGVIAMETPRQRAYTYQLARAQTVPTAQAEVIARAFDLAAGGRDRDLALLAGQVYAPLAQALTPSADMAWFGATAVRVLLAADLGGTAAAQQTRIWIDLIRGMATTSREAAAVDDTLWPYRQLLTGGDVSRDALAAWVAGEQDKPPAAALPRRALVLTLIAAVGDALPAAAWEPLIAEGFGLDPGEAAPWPGDVAWSGAVAAARASRLGEGVGLALHLLGRDGGTAPSLLAEVRAIETLAALGRGADARALALNAALARGL
jgi:hypothetical protein